MLANTNACALILNRKLAKQAGKIGYLRDGKDKNFRKNEMISNNSSDSLDIRSAPSTPSLAIPIPNKRHIDILPVYPVYPSSYPLEKNNEELYRIKFRQANSYPQYKPTKRSDITHRAAIEKFIKGNDIDVNEQFTVQEFEKIKAKNSGLINFFSGTPNVDIHVHKCGSVDVGSLMMILEKKDLFYHPEKLEIYDPKYTIRIWLDPERLSANGLTQGQVKEYLEAIPELSVSKDFNKQHHLIGITVCYSNSRELVDGKFNDFIICKTHLGSEIKIAEVGHITKVTDLDKEGCIPTTKLSNYQEHLNKFEEAGAILHVKQNARENAGQFFASFNLLTHLEYFIPIEEWIIPYLESARNQNIQYNELMSDILPIGPLPKDFEKKFTKDNLINNLEEACVLLESWADDYVKKLEAKLNAIDKAIREHFKTDIPIYDVRSFCVLKFMKEILRFRPLPIFFANTYTAFRYIKHDKRRMCGINVAGPEHYALSRKCFDDQLKILKFLSDKFDEKNISMHAGELEKHLCNMTMSRNIIRKTIEVAKRIGHGVSIGWENNQSELLKEMRRKGVTVEICLTSNHHILGTTAENHPMKQYLNARVPCSICTDDAAVNCSNLLSELEKAAIKMDLTYNDIKKSIMDSLNFSFLSGDGIYDYDNKKGEYRLKDGFENVHKDDAHIPETATMLIESSEKAKMQVRFLKHFIEFEAKQANMLKKSWSEY